MSEENDKNEMPCFKVTEKKVDSSWKEEIRKERDAAKAKAAEQPNPTPGSGTKGGGGGSSETSKIFVNFLAGMIQQVLMQLGKVENPFAAGGEIDPEGAKYTIELLTVIQQKTKGNLSAQEERILGDSLRDLRMQFVDTMKMLERQALGQAKPEQMR